MLKFPYLRESFQKGGKKVSNVIAETLPNTAILALASILVALCVGVFLGVISALKKDTFLDLLIQLFSTLGMSLPSFFSAILVAWLFGFVLHKYTGLSMSGSLYELDDYGEGIYLNLKNLILPAFVLSSEPWSLRNLPISFSSCDNAKK